MKSDEEIKDVLLFYVGNIMTMKGDGVKTLLENLLEFVKEVDDIQKSNDLIYRIGTTIIASVLYGVETERSGVYAGQKEMEELYAIASMAAETLRKGHHSALKKSLLSSFGISEN